MKIIVISNMTVQEET